MIIYFMFHYSLILFLLYPLFSESYTLLFIYYNDLYIKTTLHHPVV